MAAVRLRSPSASSAPSLDDPETSAAGNVAMVPLGTPVAGVAILRLLKDSGILLVTRIAGLLVAADPMTTVAAGTGRAGNGA